MRKQRERKVMKMEELMRLQKQIQAFLNLPEWNEGKQTLQAKKIKQAERDGVEYTLSLIETRLTELEG